MIVGWRDGWLQEFYLSDKPHRKIPPDIRDRLFRKLQLIDDATTDADLRVPPANHLERLMGKLEGFHSIRVNAQWRLIFRWSAGEAHGIYLDDHSYR